MDGECGRYEDRRGAYRVLVEKPAIERTYGRPKLRYRDKNKIDFQEIG
jgi:hypothetical protein